MTKGLRITCSQNITQPHRKDMLGSSLESRDQYSLFIFNHTVNQGSISYQCKVKKK